MKTATKRATVYFDPQIHRGLRLQAAEMDRSISDLVNDAVKMSLPEDAEDLAAFKERAREPKMAFEDVLKIIKRIQNLSSDPRSPDCEKLSAHDDKYRVRQGTYQIVYTISDVGLVICIVKVGHRKEVYR